MRAGSGFTANDGHLTNVFGCIGYETVLSHHHNRHASAKIKCGKILPLDKLERVA